MTKKQAYKALIERVRVTYGGTVYRRISAVVFRVTDDNRCIISAELYHHSNSVTVVDISDVDFASEEKRKMCEDGEMDDNQSI